MEEHSKVKAMEKHSKALEVSHMRQNIIPFQTVQNNSALKISPTLRKTAASIMSAPRDWVVAALGRGAKDEGDSASGEVDPDGGTELALGVELGLGVEIGVADGEGTGEGVGAGEEPLVTAITSVIPSKQ